MKSVPVFVLAAALCGCGSVGRSDGVPAADQTVFVIGMSPEVRLVFAPGQVKDGAFLRGPLSVAVFNGKPENGYIVGRAKAGELLGLVTLNWPDRMINAPAFTACGGKATLVFDTPKDSVVYLGDLEYDSKTNAITYRADMRRAREFVDAHFPALKGRLAPHGFKVLPTADGCMPFQMMRPAPLTFKRAN
jgi:hypothetical protein